MRVLILCIMAMMLHLAPAWGADILILQSNRSPGYCEAVRGFQAATKKSGETYVLSDYAEIDVQRIVKEERPRLVVAVGDKALSSVRKLRDVPVVAMLALSHSARKSSANIGGIAMLAAPDEYLKLYNSIGVRRVGVLFDPGKMGPYLKRIEQDAKQMGVTLVAEPVTDPRDLQAKLEKIRRSIDLLWMLPDSTVFTTVNIEAFMLFSVANKLPVATFSSQYLKNGAAAALSLDYFDMGMQAGELALSVLSSGERAVPTLDPRRTQLQLNENVIRKLSLNIPEK